MEASKTFRLLDCTLRDGGYINNWSFDQTLALELARACQASGTDILEAGYLSRDPDAPLCRRCPQEFLDALREAAPGLELAAMLEADTAGEDYGDAAATGLSVLRVALHRNRVLDVLPRLSRYHPQGYQVFIQLMGITAYSEPELDRVLDAITESGAADCVSLADSYGSLLPDRTGELIAKAKVRTGLPVGLHAHNNMQLGMANVLSALDAGADVVDGSVYGMGRGGGNVPLELLVTYFEKQWPDRFHALPLLEFIDRRMLRLAREYSWGYSLSSLISGVYECHPYYTSRLIEKREYTIAQVLKAAQMVEGMDVVGFDSSLLSAIVESGFSPERLDGERRAQAYLNRAEPPAYRNAHPGRPFLVLGGGPSLLNQREAIDGFIREHDPIILGANRLAGLWTPHYHAFNNQRRFDQYAALVHPDSQLLIGPGVDPGSLNRPWQALRCLNASNTPLYVQKGCISANCRSISVLLGAVALVMGAESIAFAGLDGYRLAGEKLYYQEEESAFPEDLEEKHRANQAYLRQLCALARQRGVPVRFLTKTTYEPDPDDPGEG